MNKTMEQPVFIMMCGLPGSGKSMQAQKLASEYKAVICSSDAIRKEVTGSEENQEQDNEVFQILRQRVREALANKQNVICDACNIRYKKRMGFLNELRRYDCHKICCFVWKSFDDCVRDNNGRERVVPASAIRQMYKNFYIPQYFEGWDDIIIAYHEPAKKEHVDYTSRIAELFLGENGLCMLEHDNPHHTLTVGNHCIACYMNTLESDIQDSRLSIAALLHDIGKAFTKQHKDSRGNPCEHAHYYQHELVSAYNAVPYLQDFSTEDLLHIVALITFHMMPYAWERENNEKLKKKYQRLWGEELFNQIIKLHDADRKAH